jgi:uncharacterized protein (DUF1501 family)
MKQNRREFIAKTGCALSMVSLATQVSHFGMMSAMAQKADDEAVQTDAPSDYRALVVLFMSGGNDGNMLI